MSATSGSVPNQVAVTGTNPAAGNVGTTLKVSCVVQGGACPDVGAPGWVAVGTSGTAEQVAKLSDGSTDLVGGTTYTCYSIEVDANDSNINECSDPMDAIAALNAPTVAAQTGSVGGAMSVTATAASNTYSTLKIGCVANGESCPAVEATAWIPVTTSGSPQQVSTLAGGSGTVANTAYTCYSAEFSTLKSYRVCSEKRDVTSKALNAPSVTAASGFVPNQVAVTGAAPAAGNVGTTLKVACVVQSGGCPDFGALGWVAVGTSGTAKQVAKLSDGAADLATDTRYTCYSIEVDANDSNINECSDPMDAIAALLNAPTVVCPRTGLVGGAGVGGPPLPPLSSNQDSELKIACVADGGSCPAATGTTWISATTSGSPQASQHAR